MADQSNEEKIDDKYLESFESSNRNRKLIVLAVAVAVLVVIAAVFYRTIGSLSEMSTVTEKAFQENGAPVDPQAPASQGNQPAEGSMMMQKNPDSNAAPAENSMMMQKAPASSTGETTVPTDNNPQKTPTTDSTGKPIEPPKPEAAPGGEAPK